MVCQCRESWPEPSFRGFVTIVSTVTAWSVCSGVLSKELSASPSFPAIGTLDFAVREKGSQWKDIGQQRSITIFDKPSYYCHHLDLHIGINVLDLDRNIKQFGEIRELGYVNQSVDVEMGAACLSPYLIWAPANLIHDWRTVQLPSSMPSQNKFFTMASTFLRYRPLNDGC